MKFDKCHKIKSFFPPPAFKSCKYRLITSSIQIKKFKIPVVESPVLISSQATFFCLSYQRGESRWDIFEEIPEHTGTGLWSVFLQPKPPGLVLSWMKTGRQMRRFFVAWVLTNIERIAKQGTGTDILLSVNCTVV
jgi:hypothetical protein